MDRIADASRVSRVGVEMLDVVTTASAGTMGKARRLRSGECPCTASTTARRPPRPPSLRPPAPCFLAPPRRRRGGASRTSAVLPGGSKRPPERKHVSTNGSATFLDIWPCFRLLPVPMRAREGGSTVPGVRQHRRLDLGDEPVGGPLLSPPGRQPGRLGDGAVRRGGGRRQRRPDRRLQGAPRGERVRRHPLRPCFGSPCTLLNDFARLVSWSWAVRREPPSAPCVLSTWGGHVPRRSATDGCPVGSLRRGAPVQGPADIVGGPVDRQKGRFD